MGKDKVFVDRDEFMRQMIKCLSSEEWKKPLSVRRSMWPPRNEEWLSVQIMRQSIRRT